jgi:hypothetical protein
MAAAVAAAWVAWAEWICNTAQTVVAIKERAGFGPLFFLGPTGRTHLEVKVLYNYCSYESAQTMDRRFHSYRADTRRRMVWATFRLAT